MSDLVEFLRARLDDDEQVALAAAEGGPDWPDSPSERMTPALAHARRHDPARVLREVEAKRCIVAAHKQVPFTDVNLGMIDAQVCFTCCSRMDMPDDLEEPDGWDFPRVKTPFPCPTLRLLAAPFADHPDYREDWRA